MQCRFLQFLNFLLLFLNFHFAFEKTILELPIHTLHSHRQFSSRKRSFHEYISRRHRHWLHHREARPSGRGGKAALRRVPAALRAHAGGAFGASARSARAGGGLCPAGEDHRLGRDQSRQGARHPIRAGGRGCRGRAAARGSADRRGHRARRRGREDHLLRYDA